MTHDTIDYYTIEPSQDGDGYWLVSHGTYGETSVLAGQDKRCLTQWYQTSEEAQTAHPDAEVLDHDTRNPFSHLSNPLPDAPPEWYDYLNAGEYWSEEDY